MGLLINVGGVWKDVPAPKVNVGGVWKTVNQVWVNVSGVWKQCLVSFVYQRTAPETYFENYVAQYDADNGLPLSWAYRLYWAGTLITNNVIWTDTDIYVYGGYTYTKGNLQETIVDSLYYSVRRT